jgi:lipopolysaccharide assembly LptE-like protein
VKATFAAGLACLSLTGCFGYHIGPVKPYYLRDVHTIAVPTFKNKTLLPHIEVLVTDTVIKQLQQDGTYKIASDNDADAVLKAEITRVDRSPARSVRGNVLATREFNLRMEVRYTVAARDGTAPVPNGHAYGTTSFFVSADVTTDERQALPLATEDLASQLVTQLSEGW